MLLMYWIKRSRQNQKGQFIFVLSGSNYLLLYIKHTMFITKPIPVIKTANHFNHVYNIMEYFSFR